MKEFKQKQDKFVEQIYKSKMKNYINVNLDMKEVALSCN